MVEDNGLEVIHDVTQITGTVSGYMAFMLSCCHNTVVASRATSGNAGVVITAICLQFDKTGGIVAIIAFNIGWRMLVRGADGSYSVMALTALTKNL